jgi:cell division protein FtsN
MSTAVHTSELDALRMASSCPARKTRGVFVSFATLVVVGLGLAGWYVSERILSAQSQPAQAVRPVVTAPPAAVRESKPPATDAAQAVLPLALEYYLQIASLGTSEDASYMRQLEEKGYRTQFDAAAAGRDARILIGPYSDESSLTRAREKLIASGILAIEYIR